MLIGRACLSRSGKSIMMSQRKLSLRTDISGAQPVPDGTNVTKRPMLQFQNKLPRLPVPNLRETCMKYMYSVQQLSDESSFKTLQQDVAQLLQSGGIGEKLQTLLEKRAAASPTSWLEDWWYRYGYLEVRDPIVINVNYFYAMRPADCPEAMRNSTHRAAKAILGALSFLRLVENESLSPDMNKNTPLSMEQYTMLFSTCRIPQKSCDVIMHANSKIFRHITVLRKGQIYSMDVCSANDNKDGDYRALPLYLIENQLDDIKHRAESQISMPIGIFTTEERDRWADLYGKLAKLDLTNAKHLNRIATSLFTVCLDDTHPTSLTDISMQFLHGNQGENRWFDKQIQMIVCDNGEIGFNFEHAHIDGMTTVRFVDHIDQSMRNKENDHLITNPNLSLNLAEPTHLVFVTDNEMAKELDISRKNVTALIDNNETVSHIFTKFGTEAIKREKCSPDAFAQLAFQLAHVQLHGKPAPTYEAASTKQFKHGRTETGRSNLPETFQFCQQFVNNKENAELRTSMLKALDALTFYMKQAKDGMGVDRHLLGLQLLAQENNLEMPRLFNNPLFKMARHWRLSTSHCGSESLTAFGFGPVVPDGYGIGYFMLDDRIHLTITSKRDCPTTNARALMHAIQQSLVDLYELSKKHAIVSKL